MPRDLLHERRPSPGPLAEAPARREATVIPLPPRPARPARPAPGGDEVRGEVVLFLGVRYERLAS